MLKVSVFYLEKQKSFIPKNFFFWPQSISKQKSLFTDPNFSDGFDQNRLLVPACHRLFVFTNLLCYQPGPCNQTIQTWNSYFQSINKKVLQFCNLLQVSKSKQTNSVIPFLAFNQDYSYYFVQEKYCLLKRKKKGQIKLLYLDTQKSQNIIARIFLPILVKVKTL